MVTLVTPERTAAAPLAPSTRTITGGALACEALLAMGATTLFGYPGGAALPFYRELARYPRLRHVLVRHEQNAAHAADGSGRDQPTHGPGDGVYGLRPDSRPHGSGCLRRDRHAGLPGSRRRGHGRAD